MLQTIMAAPILFIQLIGKLLKAALLGSAGVAFGIVAFGCISALDFRLSTGFESLSELLFFGALGLGTGSVSLASFLKLRPQAWEA